MRGEGEGEGVAEGDGEGTGGGARGSKSEDGGAGGGYEVGGGRGGQRGLRLTVRVEVVRARRHLPEEAERLPLAEILARRALGLKVAMHVALLGVLEHHRQPCAWSK